MKRRLTLLLAALLCAGARADWTPLEPLSNGPVASFERPEWLIDPAKAYRAILKTSQGDVTVQLYPQAAPKTVNSFVFLALNHFYDGTPFHRVIAGFMAQGGDPTGSGQGGPGYSYYIEPVRELRFDKAGVLGMARTQDPASNGSQFFITLAPADYLSGQYTVFGQVVAGMDAVNALKKIDPQKPDPAVKPDTLLGVTVEVENSLP